MDKRDAQGKPAMGMTLRSLIGALNEVVRDGADLDSQVVVQFDADEWVEIKQVRLESDDNALADGVLVTGDVIIEVY